MTASVQRSTTIIANWKMHKTLAEAKSYIAALAFSVPHFHCHVGVAVPFTMINAAAEAARGTNISVGSQNVSDQAQGAFTGDVSCVMIKDAGATFCLIGHSERRKLHGETDESINAKMKLALQNGLKPVLCVGETLEEHKKNMSNQVLERQLTKDLEGIGPDQANMLIIAYEPIWAIGTGIAATPEIAQKAHKWCRDVIGKLWRDDHAANAIPLIYGGSVKPDNAEALISEEDIDGFLVGGASLDVETFVKILQCRKNQQEVK